MGQANIPPAAKIIIGLIYHNSAIKVQALASLERRLGKIDFYSQEMDFNYTDYYEQELGKPLKRIFVSFKLLRQESLLSGIKLYTNELEKHFSLQEKRQINIDPGFLNSGKLILATTKVQKHRIYLGKGIFAEVTLFYGRGTFKPWPWTYLDYRTKEYIDIFNSIRQIYLQQMEPAPG